MAEEIPMQIQGLSSSVDGNEDNGNNSWKFKT